MPIFGKQLADASVALAKLASDVTTLINGMLAKAGGTMAGNIDMAGFRLTNIGAPTQADHVVRLQDVQAMPWKERVVFATTGNIDLSTGGTALSTSLTDGITPSIGQRALVWKQTVPAQNGIYLVGSGAWTRAGDADTATDLRAAMVTAETGTLYADHRFAQTAEPTTLGTDAVVWVDIGTGAPAGFPTGANKNMAAELTAADYALACNTGLTYKPIQGSYVSVLVNGVAVPLADGNRDQAGAYCYFSGDSGASARALAAVVATDKLYWKGSVATFQLSTSDRLDFNYLV